MMELIFFYINQSKTKFIEKQGFNFSSRYRFSVEYDKGTYILKGNECEKQLSQNFFDETGCVTNVTAIVGENGSGKTTLLTKLLEYSGQVKDEAHDSDYDAFFTEEYEIDKVVSIYWDGGNLVCYHNIDEFKSDTKLLKENRIFYFTQGSDILKNMIANDKGFCDISKICVSNSMYALNNEVVPIGNLEQLNINMNSMQELGNRFFRKKIRSNNHIAGGYFEIQDIMANEKRMMDFQYILDILYLDYIHSNQMDSLFAENIGKVLYVQFHTAGKILNDYYRKKLTDKSADKEWAIYYDVVMKNAFGEFDYELVKNDICFHLYTNLLYELIVGLEIENEDQVKDKKELLRLIEKLLDQIKEKDNSTYEVLEDAYAEIQEYEKVLEKAEIVKSSLPSSDWGYWRWSRLEYRDKERANRDEETDIYQSFMKVIKKSVFERRYSFVLKYIDIQGIELASGERALMNFFSWIYFVPKFTQIMREENQASMLHKNILLLIDEIDLYCHPLWQQKMLTFLIDELKSQYSDKNVQIIFTTHSPIILSDIPCGNIIFLKRENARCKVDDNNLHAETFGANIYKLFNNAFFLGQKGQIGEFSRNKIQTIIDKVSPEMHEEEGAVYHEIPKKEVVELEKEIALIGEPIVRNKLYDMLYKCQYCSKDSQKRKLELYRRKLEKLEEEMRHGAN